MTLLTGVAQAVAAVFWVMTAFYAVLASQSFAYEQFLRPDLVPAIGFFARNHQWLCAGLLALYLAAHAFGGTARHPRTRILLYAVGGVWALSAGVLSSVPSLAALAPGGLADILVFAALVPLLLIAAVDVAAAEAFGSTPPQPRHASDFAACAAAAVIAFTVSALVGLSRDHGLDGAAAMGAATSAVRHLTLFAAFFLLLTAARAIAAMVASRRCEALTAATLLAGALFLALWRTVLPAVMAPGPQLLFVAAAFALTIAAAVAGRGLQASRGGQDAVLRVTGACAPTMTTSRAGLVLWLVLVTVVARSIAVASETADWNFVVADLSVMLTWALVLAAMLRFVQFQSPGKPALLFALAGLVLALNIGWNAVSAAVSGEEEGSEAAIEWTRRDPAARLLADAVAPRETAPDAELFNLLQRQTNVPASVHVDPVEVSLGARTGPPGYRPHIFLFIIDSLRRDYVGAYNPSVSFTPAIDAFARESVVFKRAFTRYGATGLSVPSIWTGGMLLHKQYVTPFFPMNALAKLLASEDYAQWVAMDNIIDVILPPSERRESLDAHRAVKDFRFCGTLSEIQTRVSGRAPDSGPVFTYALPQDIHVSSIAREGSTSVDQEDYNGFYAPVASRIKRFDRCFGAFVEELKARGWFDDSIIIVTSDHGDSLGEGGRMGHAYTLFPEILQIPLIVHLPPRLSAALDAENEGAVFSTDITPTLYALLGIPPERPRNFFGRPLFRARGTRPRPADVQAPVVASSYGAVYGALLDQQRSLYVLDTINLREHAFSLDGTGAGVALALTPQMREEAHESIRATVAGIAEFYKFAPAR